MKKAKKVKDAKYHFFHRYKHLLKDAIFIGDLLEREREESSEESESEEEGERPEQTAKTRDSGKSAVPAMGVITEEEEEEEPRSKGRSKLSRITKSRSSRFPTRSGSNRPVQSQ